MDIQIISTSCIKFADSVSLQQMTTEKRIWTFTQFCSYYPWPTIAGLRHLHLYRKQKGLEEAFWKVGKRVLVDVDKFWELLKEKQEEKK